MNSSYPARSGPRRRWPARAWLAGFAIAALVGAGSAGAQAPASSNDGFAELAQRLLPAVVNISTTQTIKPDQKSRPDLPEFPPGSPFEEFFKDFFNRHGGGDNMHPQARKATSLGSGFIIDPSGLVVTNNHVIADADEITVILQDDTNLKAELVGRDTKTDLALLRVHADHPLPAAAFGDSDKERVGDWVLAVGNPYGLGGTLTAGIISARSREINNSGPYDDFLQTDAAINRGNSGGPLFNLDGEVIGINTAIFSPSGGSIGIGFAIPSSLARPVVAQLQQYGHARRGWIGVRIQSVNGEIAQSLGLDKPRGALIAGLIEGGPAERAGLEPGDVVLSFGGKPVKDLRHFERLVADAEVDRQVQVTLWRKRAEATLPVKVGELDEGEQQVANLPKQGKPEGDSGGELSALGLSLAEATPELRAKYQLPEAAAVVITKVAHGGPAADKDLKAGDVVVEVAQEEVKSLDDVSRKLEEAKKAGRKSVLLLIDRSGDLRFVALRMDQG